MRNLIKLLTVFCILLMISIIGCSLEESIPTGVATNTGEEFPSELSKKNPDAAASFTVIGDIAEMNGVIGSGTPNKVRNLIRHHPNVTTIVMVIVPGSTNDEANVVAARKVRNAGLDTYVRADGEIASGGVDFFCAGVNRTIEEGALVGVHAWGAGQGQSGADLPPDDPAHQLYLDFYAEMGIPEEFYWFTLEAAPPEDIHWMTTEEIEQYGLITN